MASQYPGATDAILVTNTGADITVKSSIDAIQTTHRRLAREQAAVAPGIGGTVGPDTAVGSILAIQMPAGNITIANPVLGSLQAGDFVTFIIKQDSIGGRTITWGTKYRKSLSLSVTPSAIDVVTFRYLASDDILYEISAVLGVS